MLPGVGEGSKRSRRGPRPGLVRLTDAAVLLRTHASGGWLPTQVKDVLSNPGVTKIHAGDGKELRERIRTSFGVDLRGELDLRTRAKAPQDVEARLEDLSVTAESDWSSVELEAQQVEVAAKRALLCWKHAEQLQPKAAPEPQPVSQRVWAQQCVVRRHDGLYCWACQAGPVPTDAHMQKHIDGAQHKRRMVLSGILEDDQILPPVPPSLAARGIVLQKGKDGTLQYMCQKCKAGPFPTLDSVDSHLHGAKHLHKEGREPELQLTADLAKEGFVLSAAGELECRLCEAGPFRDRQSLRLHRQSLQHRGHGDTCARPPRMEEEVRELPGYCNLLGNAFCCFLCDVSAPSLDGMLQHLAGKSHRKACQAHGEPEPLILCRDLVAEQVSEVYPLQGRLRDVDLEPIFRKGVGTWQEAGPGQKKPQGVAASEGLPKPPRAMVSKDDVENGSDPSYLAAKVGDKVIVVSDDAGSPWVWAEIDEQRGWFPRDVLVKKLPPWKLKKAASKTVKAACHTTPAPPRVMVVRAEPLNFPDLPVGQQLLHAEAGEEVTILMVGEGGDWVWAECKGEQGMFPRRFLEERKAFEQVEQGVLESDSDFELQVTPPETPLDWSAVGRRRFYGAEDVTEAFLRVAKMREERLESQQMSASEILKEAIRKTSERQVELKARCHRAAVDSHVAGAEHAAEEATKEGEKVVNEVENATLQVVPRVVNATEALLAKSTKPLEVPAPPAQIPYRDFVSSAAATVGKSILYWIMPIVADLFFISLAFVLFELAMGVGRYSSIYREDGLVRTASGLLTDICSGWVYGACALVACWVLGILLAQELRPMAEKIQDTPLHPVDSFSPLLDALGDPKLELVPPASSASWNLARCLWVAVAEILGSLVAAEKAAFPKGDLRNSKLLGVLRFGAREGGSLC
eukprot:s2786_g11.t1